jgi:hypothetical protein
MVARPSRRTGSEVNTKVKRVSGTRAVCGDAWPPNDIRQCRRLPHDSINSPRKQMEDVMSQLKSIALAALLGIAAAGFSGQVSAANAESASPAQAKVYAQNEGVGGELSVRTAQDAAAKSQDTNPWAVTSGSSGVHIQSRAGFVGYH